MNTENKKPVAQYKEGCISISEWENETTDGTKYKKYTITKFYKEKDATEWKKTNSLNEKDLDKIQNLITKIKGDKQWNKKKKG